ncbi:hypothetical protein M758_1G061300 [Ceratodon purpureus]|nr:hypothetical protein M758_1G061300 [Ceratodon purpureus]
MTVLWYGVSSKRSSSGRNEGFDVCCDDLLRWLIVVSVQQCHCPSRIHVQSEKQLYVTVLLVAHWLIGSHFWFLPNRARSCTVTELGFVLGLETVLVFIILTYWSRSRLVVIGIFRAPELAR